MKTDLAEIMKNELHRDIPIEELMLPARAYNALKLNGIRYLSEFIGMSLAELKKLDYVSTSIAESILLCANEQLHLLRKNYWEKTKKAVNPAALPPMAGEQEREKAAGDQTGESETAVKSSEWKIIAMEDDRSIEVLNLSPRAYNALKRARINTIRELS